MTKNFFDSSRNSAALAGAAERVLVGEQLLQLLRERRLRDAALADAEQLDLAVQRRLVAVVQRADHVVRRGQRFVAIELAARERHQVRRVQPRVLGVDRHEHLDDVIFGEAVEDDRRHRELLVAEAIDVGVQREQAVLAVDGAQDAFALGHLQAADATNPLSTGSNVSFSSHEMITAPGIDGRSRAWRHCS